MTPCTQWPRDPMYLMTSFTCWTVWWGITDVTDKYMRHHRRDGQVHEASPTWRTSTWGITDVTDKYMSLSIASDNSYFVFHILIPKGLRWQAFSIYSAFFILFSCQGRLKTCSFDAGWKTASNHICFTVTVLDKLGQLFQIRRYSLPLDLTMGEMHQLSLGSSFTL